MRKLSTYKKSLILFTLFLIGISLIFLSYVYDSMIIYERNLVDNYIEYLLTSGKITDSIDNDLFKVSNYEVKNAKISDGLKKLYKSDSIKIKKNSELSKDDIYAYDLYNKDKLISTVSLKSKRQYKKMAILTIEEWEVESIDNYIKDGLYSYEVNVPINYQVYFNDKLLGDDVLVASGDVTGLERLTEFVEIEKSNHYKVSNLVNEPKIKILDENKKEVKYEVKNGVINITKDFLEYKTLEEAKEHIKDNFDVLELARNYSLFLTDDLHGERHGFNILDPYLISGTYMYNLAYGWATNVDITFVSSHRLASPVFTNERLENFIIYNDNAFSAEVYLEKNMYVSGKSKQDIMHDRMYFIYYDGGYKLVDMKAI